jgi:hypothetical protein
MHNTEFALLPWTAKKIPFCTVTAWWSVAGVRGEGKGRKKSHLVGESETATVARGEGRSDGKY